MNGSKEPSMHYTEPGIRVITVFFAALVGFGLKHLADETAKGHDGHPDDLTCFVLAVLLFLRFLLGSANHLWYEYIRSRPPVKTSQLGIDLAALTGYGIIAVYICYAETLTHFLWGSVFLLLGACIWLGVDAWFAPGQERQWKNWLIINLVQGVVLVCVALGNTSMGDIYPGYASWKVILLLVFIACLVFDFHLQMQVLKRKPGAETDTPGGTC